MEKLTECQKRLLKAMPEQYYVEDGKLKKRNPAAEETALEFFICETYGE